MQHVTIARSLLAASVIAFAGVSAVSSVSADEMTGSSTATEQPRPPMPPMPPMTGSGNMMHGSGAAACSGEDLIGQWRGSLSLRVEWASESDYEGDFRLMDVGGDATEGTEDDVVYEGTFYASENEDGVIEAVLTDEDGAVSDYASFEYVSDNEIEGTVSFNGVETFVKAARECKRQPRKDDRHGAMNGSGMTVDSNGNSIRMNGEGMEVRQEMRQIRKSMLSEALKAKLDVRLEKMDEEVRHAFYPRVIERIDEIVAKLPDGKKKQLYIDLRDYFEQKWYEEFPEDVESAEEDILDEVFSSEE